VYMPMVVTFHSQGQSPEYYRNMEAVVTSLPPDDKSLAAQRLRGTVLSHREWLAAHAARARLRKQGASCFDVVAHPRV
jgi:amidase